MDFETILLKTDGHVAVLTLNRPPANPVNLDMGLVDRVCPPERIMADALDMAGELARRPPLAVGAVLRAMTAGLDSGMDKGL